MQPKTKTSLKRIGTILLWMSVIAGVIVLVTVAVQGKNNSVCKGIVVNIKGDHKTFFVEPKDVKALITKNNNPVGKALGDINTLTIEQIVKRDPWIRSAEIYIDNNKMLNVAVTEREPVARIFTFSGKSYYLDEEGERIPVSSKYSALVPVFTSFPSDADTKKLSKSDSLLTSYIITVANYIKADTFWNAQIEQVQITKTKKFEMTPKLGEHVIEFGDGTNTEAKFKKLLIFYKEALNKVGWNTYSRINVAYENEVYALKKDGKKGLVPTVDTTVQLAQIENSGGIETTMERDDDEDDSTSATPKKDDRKITVATAAKPAKGMAKSAAKSGAKPKAVYQPRH
ncbi:cell division protein FtsQ [Chitinophaga skermanii]|uniref:Cell division protein FtsQ n=1 Tax=Chitinophaga skermanii TaxID=331697 RepID=A0A327Q408_9BACT|nr:hypothetical protein [Chitinophaga skermanii]RAI98471.1 cell division protein FtsQ [Chitinophaga skermanii]